MSRHEFKVGDWVAWETMVFMAEGRMCHHIVIGHVLVNHKNGEITVAGRYWNHLTNICVSRADIIPASDARPVAVPSFEGEEPDA